MAQYRVWFIYCMNISVNILSQKNLFVGHRMILPLKISWNKSTRQKPVERRCTLFFVSWQSKLSPTTKLRSINDKITTRAQVDETNRSNTNICFNSLSCCRNGFRTDSLVDVVCDIFRRSSCHHLVSCAPGPETRLRTLHVEVPRRRRLSKSQKAVSFPLSFFFFPEIIPFHTHPAFGCSCSFQRIAELHEKHYHDVAGEHRQHNIVCGSPGYWSVG